MLARDDVILPCGSGSITLSHFQRFVTDERLSGSLWFSRGLESDTQSRMRALSQNILARMCMPFTQQARKSSLETLLRQYKCSLCSDPRDKIYALLGIANRRSHRVALYADYSQDTQDLFWDVLAFCRVGSGLSSCQSGSDLIEFCKILRDRLCLTNESLRALHTQHTASGLHGFRNRFIHSGLPPGA